jgi:coenzyme F420-reducing hydrogenase beta subunit
MSGGAYDYTYLKVERVAEEIDLDGGSEGCATPLLRQAFKNHLQDVAAALKAIEWNDSGDGDDDEEDLIKACLPRHTPKVKELLTQVKELKERVTQLKLGLFRRSHE